jgi:hypothetical protein
VAVQSSRWTYWTSKSRRRVRGPVTERTSSKRLVPQNVTVMDVPV